MLIHWCLAKALRRELLGVAQKAKHVLGHLGTGKVSVVGTYCWGVFLKGNKVPSACGTSISTLWRTTRTAALIRLERAFGLTYLPFPLSFQ